jgi:hypothetical protein
VDVVVGSEITNRFDIRYLARTPSDTRDTVSRLMSETIRYVREKSRAGHYETKAFWDMVVCGLGCVELYQDFEEDDEGLTLLKRISPFYVRPDPFAREVNLRDSRYVIRRAWVSRRDMKYMFEDKWDDLKESIQQTADSAPSGIQRIMGYSAKDAGFYNAKSQEFLVNDYQYYLRRKLWKVRNPITQEVLEARTEKEYKQLVDMIRESALINSYPITDAFEMENVNQVPRREYRRAYICGDIVLAESDIPTNHFSYYFITGFEDHQEDKTSWFGLVRPLRDPQRWSNKFFSQMIYMVSTSPKGGLYYEDGAFDDEEQAKRDHARPNTMIKVLPGGINKIHQREQLRPISGLDSMMEHAINAIPNVSGVNYFLQGLQSGNQPGVVVQSYQKQGMVILSCLLDALQQYREDVGDGYLAHVREYMPDNRIIRINDELGADQIVHYSKELASHKYDIVVSQSPTTPNQQKEFWEMMTTTNLFGQLMQLFPIPSSIFNYMPLPDQFKKDWVKEVEMQKQMMAGMPTAEGATA